MRRVAEMTIDSPSTLRIKAKQQVLYFSYSISNTMSKLFIAVEFPTVQYKQCTNIAAYIW